MSARVDGIQIAVPRAVTDAAQQHAAQRQPLIAQDQATEAVKGQARVREQRPEAVRGGNGGKVREELVEAPGDPRDGGPRQHRPRKPRPGTALPGPGSNGPEENAAPLSPDGKGRRVDVRL